MDLTISTSIGLMQPPGDPALLHLFALISNSGIQSSMIVQWMQQNRMVDAVNSLHDKHHRTPLHVAASVGNERAAKVFLELGVDPNAFDSNGNTALILAGVGNHSAMVSLLLSFGANPWLTDQRGRTALSWAKDHLRLLRNNKSTVSTSTSYLQQVEIIIEQIGTYMHRQQQQQQNQQAADILMLQRIDQLQQKLKSQKATTPAETDAVIDEVANLLDSLSI